MNTKTKDKISALLLVIRRVAYAEGNMAARAAGAEDSEMRCYFSDLAEECSHFGDMLDELDALMRLSLPKEQVLEQKRQETANDCGKKRKAKFPLRMSEVLAILGGSFLGALLTRILLG